MGGTGARRWRAPSGFAVAHGFGDEAGGETAACATEAVLRLIGPKVFGRPAASVLTPLARKSTDVVAEAGRACQRGKMSAYG